MSDETRQKLSLSNKLKESESEINRLQDQLEDEEDAKAAIQKNLTATQTQVGESLYNGSTAERFLEFVARRARNRREKKILLLACRARRAASLNGCRHFGACCTGNQSILRDKLHSHVTLSSVHWQSS